MAGCLLGGEAGSLERSGRDGEPAAHNGSAAAARMTRRYGIGGSPSIGAPATHRGTPQRVEELSGALQPPAQASVLFLREAGPWERGR
jgi:hypothetical protein